MIPLLLSLVVCSTFVLGCTGLVAYTIFVLNYTSSVVYAMCQTEKQVNKQKL